MIIFCRNLECIGQTATFLCKQKYLDLSIIIMCIQKQRLVGFVEVNKNSICIFLKQKAGCAKKMVTNSSSCITMSLKTRAYETGCRIVECGSRLDRILKDVICQIKKGIKAGIEFVRVDALTYKEFFIETFKHQTHKITERLDEFLKCLSGFPYSENDVTNLRFMGYEHSIDMGLLLYLENQILSFKLNIPRWTESINRLKFNLRVMTNHILTLGHEVSKIVSIMESILPLDGEDSINLWPFEGELRFSLRLINDFSNYICEETKIFEGINMHLLTLFYLVYSEPSLMDKRAPTLIEIREKFEPAYHALMEIRDFTPVLESHLQSIIKRAKAVLFYLEYHEKIKTILNSLEYKLLLINRSYTNIKLFVLDKDNTDPSTLGELLCRVNSFKIDVVSYLECLEKVPESLRVLNNKPNGDYSICFDLFSSENQVWYCIWEILLTGIEIFVLGAEITRSKKVLEINQKITKNLDSILSLLGDLGCWCPSSDAGPSFDDTKCTYLWFHGIHDKSHKIGCLLEKIQCCLFDLERKETEGTIAPEFLCKLKEFVSLSKFQINYLIYITKIGFLFHQVIISSVVKLKYIKRNLVMIIPFFSFVNQLQEETRCIVQSLVSSLVVVFNLRSLSKDNNCTGKNIPKIKTYLESLEKNIQYIKSHLAKMPVSQCLILSLKNIAGIIGSSVDELILVSSNSHVLRCVFLSGFWECVGHCILSLSLIINMLRHFKLMLGCLESQLELLRVRLEVISGRSGLTSRIESEVALIRGYINSFESSVDIIFSNFLKCSRNSILCHLIKRVGFGDKDNNSTSSDNMTVTKLAEGMSKKYPGKSYHLTWTILSQMTLMESKFVLSRLYECSKMVDDVLIVLNRVEYCNCVDLYKSAQKPPYYHHVLFAFSHEVVHQHLHHGKLPEKEVPEDDNRLCLCLVIKFYLYPSLVKCLCLLIDTDLDILSTMSRKFEKYTKTDTFYIDSSKLIIHIIDVIVKITLSVKKSNRWKRCFCTKPNDPYYKYFISAIICISSLVENIFDRQNETGDSIKALSALKAELEHDRINITPVLKHTLRLSNLLLFHNILIYRFINLINVIYYI